MQKKILKFMNNKTHNDTSLVYVRNTDSAFSLSAGQDIVIDNKSPGTIIELRETGTVTIDAKNDVVFNQELDTLNLLYSNDHTQLNLSSADKIYVSTIKEMESLYTVRIRQKSIW